MYFDFPIDIFCLLKIDKFMNNLVIHFQILDLKSHTNYIGTKKFSKINMWGAGVTYVLYYNII